MNESDDSEFVKKMGQEFTAQINFEKTVMGEYYSEEEIRTILNDKYNFILTKENLDMGRIDLEDLKEFNANVLFSRWEHDMESIYDEFTTTTKHVLENKSDESRNILDKAAVMLL